MTFKKPWLWIIGIGPPMLILDTIEEQINVLISVYENSLSPCYYLLKKNENP